MPIVKGICKNYGECDLADGKVEQEVDKLNFVCEECGKPLYPLEKPVGPDDPVNKKLIGLIVGGVVALGLLGGGGYMGYSSWQQSKTEEEALEKARLDSIAKADAEQKKAKEAEKLASQHAIDSLAALNESMLAEQQRIQDSLRQDSIKRAQDKGGKGGGEGTTSGKVNLPYGVYDGPIKSGKAHGIGGTIRFTRNYSIDLKKASGEMLEVETGDRMINVKMDNNRLIQGQLKRKDGTEKWIIIG